MVRVFSHFVIKSYISIKPRDNLIIEMYIPIFCEQLKLLNVFLIYFHSFSSLEWIQIMCMLMLKKNVLIFKCHFFRKSHSLEQSMLLYIMLSIVLAYLMLFVCIMLLFYH